MPPSPIRKLMPLANAARSRGGKVYHLNIGQPDLETPAPLRERLRQITEKVYAYSPSGGTPEYLESLHAYFRRRGIDLSPGEIIATTGGSEAALFSFMTVADPGDDLLVVEPFYTNYRSFASMAGVSLVALTSHGEDGFHLPAPAAWEAALTPNTRAVVIRNPSIDVSGTPLAATTGESRTPEDWQAAVTRQAWQFHLDFCTWVTANLGPVVIDYSPKSYVGIRVGRRVWAPFGSAPTVR